MTPPSRAARLACLVIKTRLMTPEYLAAQLAVSPLTLDLYLTGRREMPLERQLCLAGLVIGQAPQYRFQAFRLRDQVVWNIERGARR
jgi:hypothetical protein